MNHYQSAAFHGGPIADVLAMPDSKTAVVNTDNGQFYLIAYPAELTHATLSFVYTCVPNCRELWLEISDNPEFRPGYSRLMRHPLLDNLAWFSIEDKGIRLYQQQVKVTSVDELVTHPEIPVVVESSQLAKTLSLAHQYQLLDTADQLPVDAVILTSYRPRRFMYYWERYSLPLTLNQGGKLYWRLRHQGGQRPAIMIQSVQLQ